MARFPRRGEGPRDRNSIMYNAPWQPARFLASCVDSSSSEDVGQPRMVITCRGSWS